MWRRPRGGSVPHQMAATAYTTAPFEKPADAASYVIVLTADYRGGYRWYRSRSRVRTIPRGTVHYDRRTYDY